MAKGIHLTDGSYHLLRLINPECIRAGECGCGFCKATYDGSGRQPQCDFGDCRNPATRHCAKFGYPICDDCAAVNARIHADAYAKAAA